jgi:quercetin dioxygenase-like cupin family protein
MKKYQEKNFFKGWFVGNFEPNCFFTNQFEVAVKRYKSKDYESCHFHKTSTEITFIVNGSVLMNNIQYNTGDIILIDPNESTDFEALTDVTTVVIKIPSSKNDKYECL